MRKPSLLAVALVLVAWAAGRADPPPSADKKIVDSLVATAKSRKPLLTRTAAIDVLGSLNTKDDATVMFIKSSLQELLKSPPCGGEKNFFLYHVVQALGRLGPAARDVVPDLVEAKGSDGVLDGAIDAAVEVILTPVPPKPKAPVPDKPQASQTPEQDLLNAFKVLQQDKGYVASLTNVLQQEQTDVALRLMAAKALGTAGADAKSALVALNKIAADAKGDADLKAVAKSASDKITAATKPPTPN